MLPWTMSAVRRLRRFRRDARGAIAIWAALAAPPLLGIGALAVDVARIYSLDAELQTAADSLARSAAVELDGRSDAITRATSAVAGLVSNSQSMAAAGDAPVTVEGLRFLKELPSSDDEAVPADAVTSDPRAAQFVEVSIAPTTVTTIFPPSLTTGVVSVSLKAKAVAGRVRKVCAVAPLFVCNPFEGTGTSLEDALTQRSVRGRLIALKGKGGGAKYFPGNFGYLEPPGNKGAAALREMFAHVAPDACFDARGVSLRTGAVNSAGQGLNVRFDMYEGALKKMSDDPNYPPAVKVTKGYTGGACKPSPDEDAMGLPRDRCFEAGNCPHMGGRMGDGDWDVVSYMAVNHGKPASATIAGVSYSFNYTAGTVAPATPPTRYEVYRWEIDNERIPGTYAASKTPEDGAPRCYAGGTPSDTPDRRVLAVAVLDCQALDERYNISGGSAPPLPARGFVKVFLTEPMDGPDDTIWGEMISILEWGRDAEVRDQVEVRR